MSFAKDLQPKKEVEKSPNKLMDVIKSKRKSPRLLIKQPYTSKKLVEAQAQLKLQRAQIDEILKKRVQEAVKQAPPIIARGAVDYSEARPIVQNQTRGLEAMNQRNYERLKKEASTLQV